jgi:hypothetical protein
MLVNEVVRIATRCVEGDVENCTICDTRVNDREKILGEGSYGQVYTWTDHRQPESGDHFVLKDVTHSLRDHSTASVAIHRVHTGTSAAESAVSNVIQYGSDLQSQHYPVITKWSHHLEVGVANVLHELLACIMLSALPPSISDRFVFGSRFFVHLRNRLTPIPHVDIECALVLSRWQGDLSDIVTHMRINLRRRPHVLLRCIDVLYVATIAVVEAIEVLVHEVGLVHADMKLENILHNLNSDALNILLSRTNRIEVSELRTCFALADMGSLTPRASWNRRLHTALGTEDAQWNSTIDGWYAHECTDVWGFARCLHDVITASHFLEAVQSQFPTRAMWPSRYKALNAFICLSRQTHAIWAADKNDVRDRKVYISPAPLYDELCEVLRDCAPHTVEDIANFDDACIGLEPRDQLLSLRTLRVAQHLERDTAHVRARMAYRSRVERSRNDNNVGDGIALISNEPTRTIFLRERHLESTGMPITRICDASRDDVSPARAVKRQRCDHDMITKVDHSNASRSIPSTIARVITLLLCRESIAGEYCVPLHVNDVMTFCFGSYIHHNDNVGVSGEYRIQPRFTHLIKDMMIPEPHTTVDSSTTICVPRVNNTMSMSSDYECFICQSHSTVQKAWSFRVNATSHQWMCFSVHLRCRRCGTINDSIDGREL